MKSPSPSPTGIRDPAPYWEQRAADLIDGYDHPETWVGRGWQWMHANTENETVPKLLTEAGCRTVLVVGPGTGRQYAYLTGYFYVTGLELSPTLVQTCRERYPRVTTIRGDVTDPPEEVHRTDATVTTAVLQHIPPDRIRAAAGTIRRLTRRLIVVQEATLLPKPSIYQWAHDYDAIFPGWRPVRRTTTDSNGGVKIELIAYAKR